MFYCFNLRKLWYPIKSILIFIIICAAMRFFLLPRIISKPYNDVVLKFSQEYGVDEHLIYAVMFVESKFDKNAVSVKNAKGLMQITDKTGIWGAEVNKIDSFETDDLFTPEINIQIGCWYLSVLMKQYGQEQDTALAAYNAGSGNVSKWLIDETYSDDKKTLKQIPYKETDRYVYKVNLIKKIYDLLY